MDRYGAVRRQGPSTAVGMHSDINSIHCARVEIAKITVLLVVDDADARDRVANGHRVLFDAH